MISHPIQNKKRSPLAKTNGEKTRRNKNLWLSLGIFLNLYLLTTLIFGEMGALNAHKVTTRHETTLLELTQLRIENDALSEQIEGLKNDPETLERIARERLGLVKEGELIYEFF